MVNSSLLGPALLLVSIASQTPSPVHGQATTNNVFDSSTLPSLDWSNNAEPPLATAEPISCPPPGVDALASLDLEAFISKPWHVLKQIPVIYQQPADLFCVRADYTAAAVPPQPFYCRFLPGLCRQSAEQSIDILNTSRSKAVNGTSIVAKLSGLQSGTSVGTGKLRVGVPYLPESFYGNYFVVAAGTYEELAGFDVAALASGANPSTDLATGATTYDWAIISSGLPESATPNGCLPGQGLFNFDGFWLFSRDPFAPPEVAARMEAVASEMGFDVSALLDVVNEGCDWSTFQ